MKVVEHSISSYSDFLEDHFGSINDALGVAIITIVMFSLMFYLLLFYQL